ncbi:hypothetical protein K1719_030965 [Acacia pycnantha]|nr:hypothetical protein K1719_030965 [Acacia pycnantha]
MGIMAEAKSEIEAVLTVSPLKVTEPRQVRQVQYTGQNSKAIAGCYHIVLYFTKSKASGDGDGDGQFLTGWAVESLAVALWEHPLMAGRLRRREDDGGDGALMEIVSNDSGIRMVEARIPMSMSQLLGMTRNDFVEVEADLVFWKDVDEHTPDFSPLFYIQENVCICAFENSQVTNFECGGYSIGISCSLLLTEFLIVENFLKKWSDTHRNIKTQNQEDSKKPVTPIFYHPRLKKSESPPIDIITRSPTRNQLQNLIFKVTSHQDTGFQEDNEEEDNMWKELGMICVEKAEKKLERNMMIEKISLMVTKCGEVIRVVGSCYKRSSAAAGPRKKVEEEVVVVGTTWDDEFGEYEIEFEEGNKAVFVSRWINNGSACEDDHEALVVAVPSPKQGVSAVIMVSLPV